jgi:spore maturation protein CgeB
LLFEPARRLPGRQFVLAGALYPKECRWTANIKHVKHLAPGDHPAFFCSSRMTLNVTRQVMAAAGWCPSGRLFEASACGAPILSDWWEGLDQFYTPGQEILIARDTADAIAALEIADDELSRIANAARERTLEEHTATHRAAEFESLVQHALRPAARTAA